MTPDPDHLHHNQTVYTSEDSTKSYCIPAACKIVDRLAKNDILDEKGNWLHPAPQGPTRLTQALWHWINEALVAQLSAIVRRLPINYCAIIPYVLCGHISTLYPKV